MASELVVVTAVLQQQSLTGAKVVMTFVSGAREKFTILAQKDDHFIVERGVPAATLIVFTRNIETMEIL